MSTAEARLWEIVEAAAMAVTDEATGRFENKDLIEEVRDRLDGETLSPHVRAATLDMQAKSLAAAFVSRRNPKPRNNGAMFHPGAILPLGDGKRVWMDSATDSDLLAWAHLSTANLSRVALAEGQRQKYAADRLEALRANPGQTLGWVEREVFGYIESEPDYDVTDDEQGDWS